MILCNKKTVIKPFVLYVERPWLLELNMTG